MRNVLVLLLLLALALFGIANWTTIVAPTTLNLLFGQVEAPFGLLMLVALGGITALYAIMLMAVERRLLRDAVRSRKEFEARQQDAALNADELRRLKETVTGELSEVKGSISRLSTNITDVRDLLARRIGPGDVSVDDM